MEFNNLSEEKIMALFDGTSRSIGMPLGPDLPETLKQDIKFGIMMNTYYKKDDSTFDKIVCTIKSLLNQKYTNWHLALVGDKYENHVEFQKIVNMVPSDKISHKNLNYALERDIYHSGACTPSGKRLLATEQEVWKIGGSHAYGIAQGMLEKVGIDHFVHLDHDDTFEDYHLYHLYLAYKIFPVSFVYSQALYGGSYLPQRPYRGPGTALIRGNSPSLAPYFQINSLPPIKLGVVHSGISWKMSEFKLERNCRIVYDGERFTSADKIAYTGEGELPAADALIWTEFESYMKKNKLNYFYIPIPSVRSEGDGHALHEL